MEALPAWLGALTPGGLLLIVVLLIVLGKLMPERTHNRIVADKDKLIDLQGRQVDKLVSNSETTLHLLRSLPNSEEDRK